MRRIIVSMVIVFASFFCYSQKAQVSFEKGYFITNEGKRVECLIKNTRWDENPDKFTYKLDLPSSEEINGINEIKEFGIYNSYRYVRSVVEIDKSSDIISNLSENRNPVFEVEKLFLKVIVQGNATLYYYKKANLERLFYSLGDSSIKQLVYKRFKIDNNIIGNNEYYKQQLFKRFKCGDLSLKNVRNLRYSSRSLSKYFKKYNLCEGKEEMVVFDHQKDNKKRFNFTVKVGYGVSSIGPNKKNAENISSVDLGSDYAPRFGTELEYVLPLSNNKWSLVLETIYQSFKKKVVSNASFVSGGVINSEINYKSVEIPIGIRHRFYINNDSDIYTTASYTLFNIDFNSSIVYARNDGSILKNYDINSRANISFGLGYRFKKYNINLRYNNRVITVNNLSHESLAVSIGYMIL